MTIFVCDHDWGSMLTCIFEAWASRLGHNNVRLQTDIPAQLGLFDSYIYVKSDEGKANSVIDAINTKISPYFYHEVAYCSGAYEPDTLDAIYRMIVLGFAYGPNALDMYQFKEVARFREISRRYSRESCSFLEFVRFHQVGNVYAAHIEPKSRLLLPLAEHFSDRMPSEYWIIVDDVHKEAVIHPKNSQYYLSNLSEDEFIRLQLTENNNDEVTDLWRTYFDSIAIKERANRLCQLNHFPLWKRKHAVEFIK